MLRRSLRTAGLLTDTPSGTIWHRFTFDGYGETRDGGDWDIFPTAENHTLGRAWPLLTGERGEYELIAGQNAASRLQTIANTANDGLMLPEQVWDGRPPTDQPAGKGTRDRRRRSPERTRNSSGSPGRSRTASRSSGRRSWRAGIRARTAEGPAAATRARRTRRARVGDRGSLLLR
jgi:hypothetical protein